MWSVFRQSDVEGIQKRRVAEHTDEIAQRAARQRRANEDLEDRLERSLLLLEGLFELMAERLGVTPDDLARKIVEIDARSGALDGRRQAPDARRCPSCDAAVAPDQRSCQFCGEPVPGDDPFAV